MLQKSKCLFVLRKLPITILSSIVVFIVLSVLSSLDASPPTFSTSTNANTGKFEKITKKSTNVVKKRQTSSNEVQTERNDDTQDDESNDVVQEDIQPAIDLIFIQEEFQHDITQNIFQEILMKNDLVIPLPRVEDEEEEVVEPVSFVHEEASTNPDCDADNKIDDNVKYDSIDTSSVNYDSTDTSSVNYDSTDTSSVNYDSTDTSSVNYDSTDTSSVNYDSIDTSSVNYDSIDTSSVGNPAADTPALPQEPFDDSLDVALANPPEDEMDAQWPGWLTNYCIAAQKAKDEQKMLFVYFYDTKSDSPYKTFETESLLDEEVQKSLEDYICVRIPVTVKLQPIENKNIRQIPGTKDDQKQLDETSVDAENDVLVLAENVTQTNDKAVLTQTTTRASQSSTGTRYSAMRPSGETMDASKLLPPGRDMGSVNQLKAETFDLTFTKLEQEIMLIRHPAFYEMLNTPGIAIIDFQHKDAGYYGKIVSVFPFLKKRPYTIRQTRAMLNLPPGTVTQRSLIFAVRIHPEAPKSSDGELSPRLVEEARTASQYQADIRKQGHHSWDRRFQRINTYLPTELLACEVCAESWPGQHLLESAIECVDCWRFSEGHWSAVSAEHPYYGYDMKLGTNGIWYATGVFGKWRHSTLAKAGTLTGGESQQLPKR